MTVAAGRYYLGALADAAKTQPESNGNNNGLAHATQITIPAAGKELYYIYPDHLNTPRVISNTAGRAVWRWDNTDPFGNNPALDDPDGDGQKFEFNLRFPGQYYDRESGLHYNYHRDYNPRTGRYVQSDPIGLEGGITAADVRNEGITNYNVAL